MAFRLTLTGVGAMNSPRFAPAGLLVEYNGREVMVDGARDSVPAGFGLDAWLVTDDRSELIRQIRLSAQERCGVACVGSFSFRDLALDPLRVIHHFARHIRLHHPGREASHRVGSRVLCIS